MSKFTKGKWKINEYCDVLAENNQLVALINEPRNKKEAQANARLIAAAPEMYNWLKAFLQVSKDGTVINTRHIKELLARIDGEAKNE